MKKNKRNLIQHKGIIFCAAMSLSSAAMADPLDLADEPLFLGVSTDPNIFFMIDDSGSMDWSVLTVPHYEHCQYNVNAPGKAGSYDCASAKRADGLWSSNVTVTTTNWWGSTTTSQRDLVFGFMFSNADSIINGCNGNGVAVEGCGGFDDAYADDWRGGASDFNVVFYNPLTNYSPWAGTDLPDADFSAARSDPQPAIASVSAQSQTETQYAIPAQAARSEPDGYSITKDLDGFTYHVWIDSHGYDEDDGYPRRGTNFNRTEGANGEVDLWDNFYRYTVNSGSVTWEKVEWTVDTASGKIEQNVTATGTFSGTATDPNVTPARTVAEIQQNVANWYSYARRRSFVTKGAVGAVVTASPSFRFGLSVFRSWNNMFIEMPDADISKYTGYNTSLLNDLYSMDWPFNYTYLRTGLERAGRYYKGELSGKPSPITQSCQQNFTVLFTDGYWNGDDPVTNIGDADGDGIGGSGSSETTADVARYYYLNDLSDLDNNVIPNDVDPATYQHMVTFPVAFGLTGSLQDTDDDGWPNPVLTESNVWGANPHSADVYKIDDLWHAAYNSKGKYVAAQTPEDVVNSLVDALSEISSRDASSASVATSTGQISSDTAVFQAQFNSGDWSGSLYSYPLNEDDYSVNTESPNWQAGDILDTQNWDTGRSILSYNGTFGIPFRFPANYRSPSSTEMSSEMISGLLSNAPYSADTTDSGEIAANQVYGNKLVNFLHGDRTNEGVGAGDFRQRSSVLGDIVASDPKYVGAPKFNYPDDLETNPYSTFVSNMSDRRKMVYVGANDGMLHGFDALSGEEKIAYVPSVVYHNLPLLSEAPYYHKYYVDGAPTIVDAYWGGNWHSVLAGALGKGGQAIFSLDVTNPSIFSESSAANLVLWEFTDADDADMGYSYSEPSIVKLASGKWAAVFGNGYNNTEADGIVSASGNAVLYIVDLETGALLRKIDTGVGSTSTPNGLSTPLVVDLDGDYIADYIYAGDLYGNMWKFDVSGSTSSSWDVAWTAGGTKIPLFEAGHPITTRPSVGFHPVADGQIVYFGTGKYLESSDNNSTGEPTQSFYAIWDKNLTSASQLPVERSELLEQQITSEITATLGGNTYDLRITSDHAIDWGSHQGWMMDLVNQETGNNLGERQVTQSILRNGRIIFITHLPSSTPCSPGGTSWIMELNAYNGGRLNMAPLDLDGNGVFDELDYDYDGDGSGDSDSSGPLISSGQASPEGLLSAPGILRGYGTEYKNMSASSGAIYSRTESTGGRNIGRQSWRELE